jgi:uncharacterized DUF497 family protein/Arc/MetJ family transcription regulator
MDAEWDARKAATNLKKHGVDFADGATVLHDEQAVPVRDDEPDEERYVTIGMDALARVLVVVYTWRGNRPRLIRSASDRSRASAVRGQAMKAQYNFAGGKRGPVLETPAGKTRITIRLDEDLLQWFRKQVHAAGGGSYQTLINAALRKYVDTKREPLEATLRRVLREELPRDLKRAAGR